MKSESIKPCRICSNLKDKEYSFKKYGSDEITPALPADAEKLIAVNDLKPGSARKMILKQCPECGTYYLYKTDYEYMINGTEDEEFLSRLSEEEAANYMNR